MQSQHRAILCILHYVPDRKQEIYASIRWYRLFLPSNNRYNPHRSLTAHFFPLLLFIQYKSLRYCNVHSTEPHDSGKRQQRVKICTNVNCRPASSLLWSKFLEGGSWIIAVIVMRVDACVLECNCPACYPTFTTFGRGRQPVHRIY